VSLLILAFAHVIVIGKAGSGPTKLVADPAVRHSKEFFFQGMPFQGMPQQGKFFPRNAKTRNATPRKNFSKECRFQGIFIFFINH
jgi:hypothetical protein